MKIKIYTITNCTYCNLAKELLKEKNMEYEEINLEKNLNLFSELKKKLNYTTVPMIFINDVFVGGYTNLKQILNQIP